MTAQEETATQEIATGDVEIGEKKMVTEGEVEVVEGVPQIEEDVMEKPKKKRFGGLFACMGKCRGRGKKGAAKAEEAAEAKQEAAEQAVDGEPQLVDLEAKKEE